MEVRGWTYLLVALAFALYIGIALWSRARTTAGFYVAGRSVPALANGMATGADWMSAASFISMAALPGKCAAWAWCFRAFSRCLWNSAW